MTTTDPLILSLAELPEFDPRGLYDPCADELIACRSSVLRDRVWYADPAYPRIPDARDVHVTLADAATRDRVARWLAQRVGLTAGSTAPTWRAAPRYDHGSPSVWVLTSSAILSAVSGRATVAWCARVWSWQATVLPALLTLDGDDPTLLPDGSRRVDAVALAAVARHVGGGS